MKIRMSLQRALLALIALVLLAALLPAGIAMDRRLAAALKQRAGEDLKRAAMLLEDRERMAVDALLMHARDVASTRGLADALMAGARDRARELVLEAAAAYGEEPVLVGPDGSLWVGPSPELARQGIAPDEAAQLRLITDSARIRQVALAPVEREGRRVGAAGVSRTIDQTMAGTLAGLTRAEVVVLGTGGGVVASTADESTTDALKEGMVESFGTGPVELKGRAGEKYLISTVPLGEATVVFARDLERELGVLPQLRRVAAVSAAVALVLAVLLGAIVSTLLARPVRSLSQAADRLAAGDFQAPLGRSAIREVDRLAVAFGDMRETLEKRLVELEEANRQLADRQERLKALQGEIIRKDRLAAAGRLVTELAHEIRNPVANVRNCLEVVRRRLGDDPRGLEFADLAIDELLRMHELAEGMLDLNRPRDASSRGCDVAVIAREVATLVQAGAGRDEELRIGVTGPAHLEAAIPADVLKQVLLNLVQNAREALDDAGLIEIDIGSQSRVVTVDVADDGPGIDSEIIDQIFDPFFTTKSAVEGVGLGLFVASGLVARYDGRLTAHRREAGGARFRVEVPAAFDAARVGPGVQVSDVGSRPEAGR